MQKGQFRSGAEFYYRVCRDFFPQRQPGIGDAGHLHDDADGIGFGRSGGCPSAETGEERKRHAMRRSPTCPLSAPGGGEGRGEVGVILWSELRRHPPHPPNPAGWAPPSPPLRVERGFCGGEMAFGGILSLWAS